MFIREPARRIFVAELKETSLSFQEDAGKYTKRFFITPTGVKCNRVFIVGTLTDKDNIGEGVEYWRGRISDPTGSIHVYAGQYQPDAANVLAEITTPAFVAVVGKPSIFETDDEKVIVSIRVESMIVVDQPTRDTWVKEAITRTSDQINALVAGSTMDVEKAIAHYSPDPEKYREMVRRATAAIS